MAQRVAYHDHPQHHRPTSSLSSSSSSVVVVVIVHPLSAKEKKSLGFDTPSARRKRSLEDGGPCEPTPKKVTTVKVSTAERKEADKIRKQ
eukprot:3767255-Karenia_brevis.AAC.1